MCIFVSRLCIWKFCLMGDPKNERQCCKLCSTCNSSPIYIRLFQSIEGGIPWNCDCVKMIGERILIPEVNDVLIQILKKRHSKMELCSISKMRKDLEDFIREYNNNLDTELLKYYLTIMPNPSEHPFADIIANSVFPTINVKSAKIN